MEEISTIIATIGTVGTFIYKIIIKKGRKREKEYFENVLKPYALKSSINRNINPVKYIKSLKKRDEKYVPRYIFYLVDKNQKSDSEKVMFYDYIHLYENDDNSLRRILDYILKISFYVLFALSLYFSFAGAVFVASGLTGLLATGINYLADIVLNSGNTFKLIKNDIAYLFMGSLLVGVGLLLAWENLCANEDMYSLKKNKIEKMIKRKIKKINKSYKDYVI